MVVTGPLAALLIAAATVFAGPAFGHHKPDHKVPPGHENPPGNNPGNNGNRGTIKVHEGAGEPSPIMRNQPQVCEFHIHGFKFHANQQLVVTIVGQGGSNVAGTDTWGPLPVTTNGDGEFRTESITLSDGMYKVRVDTGRNNGRGDKQKVLKIDCPDDNTPPAPPPGGGDNNPPPAPPPGGGDNNPPPAPQPGGGDNNPPPNTPPTGGNDGNNPPAAPPTGGTDGNNPPAAPENPPKPTDLPDTAMADEAPTPFAVGAAAALMVLTIGGIAIASRRRLAS